LASALFRLYWNGELDFDDVLVVRQHQRLVLLLVLGRVAIADLDGAHLREIDQLLFLDRIGRCQRAPGCVVSVYLPKRVTTPRRPSSTM